MITVCFLLSIILSGLAPSHDARMAVFRVSQVDNQLHIDLSFDIEDYQTALAVTEEQVTSTQLAQYLDEATDWRINASDDYKILVSDLNTSGEHYQATCRILLQDSITSLKISNSFLTGVKGHSNIMILNLNDTFRDFRMHAKRTALLVSY